MEVGVQYRLVVPASLAYGFKGADKNTLYVFDSDPVLISLKGE